MRGPMDILYHIPIKIPGSWRKVGIWHKPCGLYEQFGPRESSDLLEAEGTFSPSPSSQVPAKGQSYKEAFLRIAYQPCHAHTSPHGIC